MSLLTSRPRPRRFTPRIEALEDRSLPSATISGGVITTTGAVNHVTINDTGTDIILFSDGSFLGFRPEGTALIVKAGQPGSTNFIDYGVLGSADPNAANAVPIVSNLFVDFGTGNGQLTTRVASNFADFPISNLGAGSNVQVSAVASVSVSGNTQDSLFCGSIGSGASLSDVDVGGGRPISIGHHRPPPVGVNGNQDFNALLTGTEFSGASVNLAFHGGNGNNTTNVQDVQNINPGASTTINLLSGGSINNRAFLEAVYIGQLQGSLTVHVEAATGTNNQVLMGFDLTTGSLGSLISSAQTGTGTDTVIDVVHKAATDTPSVSATAQGFGKGAKTLQFTNGRSNTSVAVTDLGGFSKLIPVP
jgi:hypothetical protein